MADSLSGIVINEFHQDPSGTGQDYDGSGTADGNDRMIEFHNTTGSAVNLDGWQVHIYPPGGGSLKHTFGSTDVIPAGGYFTIVDSNGSGSTLTDVGSPAAFSDVAGIGVATDETLILYDPGAGQFIALGGPDASAYLALDIADFTTDFGATVVGSGEIAVAGAAGESWQRETDGSDTFVAGTASAGSANCFATGTRITTPAGMVAVEDLSIGDSVSAADGRSIPVKWVGRQVVSTRFGPAERLMLVRVTAGGLGDGLPLRDLTLTADHALLIDGFLINAGALVNGGSIDWVPLSELGYRYTVYHIETTDHDVILAEGAPAETFIDYVGRQSFDNHAEYLELYGAERCIPEMLTPRISAWRLVPEAIRARLRIEDEVIDCDAPLRA